MEQQNLGPADRILQAVLTYSDHAHHGRPGAVMADNRTVVGVRWDFVSSKDEIGQRIVYRLAKSGQKTVRTRMGVLQPDGKTIVEGGRRIAEYRKPGIFSEVATWMYRQVAEVWKLDNEFAARWASYQFGQEHRDLKVVLAAFLLVQSRKGDPVLENGKISFYDEDFRDVGEAMMLIYKKDGKDLNPKLLLRIRRVLEIPGIAEINREMGFGQSLREPFFGRWNKVVHKWLAHREANPRLLEGLVKAGFRLSVMALARRSGYKPTTPKFFEILRWKQFQAKDGRRQIAIGQEIQAAETWAGMTEEQICERIVKEKTSYKRIVSLVPKEVGLTRAIVAAAIEAGCLSDKDLIIAAPTLEELGLLQVQTVRERLEKAVREAEDMRAVNIAKRVKSAELKEKLNEAADNALKKAVEDVMRSLRVYVFVDRSGSMQTSIREAILLITKMLPAFPLNQMHAAYFNTDGKEITFKASSAAGVEQAFKGVQATGGTDYGAGIRALQDKKPKADEDVLFIFVGDQAAPEFSAAVRASKLNPMSFGFLHVPGERGVAVEETAQKLGIPCFRINKDTFEDTYSIPRTIRALISATPVGRTPERPVASRVSLAETILKTALLVKPTWAT